jgi:hypothetical protein
MIIFSIQSLINGAIDDETLAVPFKFAGAVFDNNVEFFCPFFSIFEGVFEFYQNKITKIAKNT